MATGCGYGDTQQESVTECWRSTTVTEYFDWENKDASSIGSYLQDSKVSCMNSYKPSVPPKPPHGPPVYREPPIPPSHGPPPITYRSQPDVCNLTPSKTYQSDRCDNAETSAAANARHISASKTENNEPAAVNSCPTFSGTQAWVRGHKSHGNMVGERLSSLQRKLRSLLTQTQQKTGEVHHIDTNKHSQSQAEYGSLTVVDERNEQNRSSLSRNWNSSATNDQSRYSCISPTGNGNVMSQSHSLGCISPVHTIERHPFASELEESRDSLHIRDTCNKLFARDSKSASCSSFINQRTNSYTNNIKSAFEFDKLVSKEVIGRPSQEKKQHDISVNQDSCDKYPHNTNLMSERQQEAPKPLSNLEPDTIYYSMKTMCCIQDSEQDGHKSNASPFSKVSNSPDKCRNINAANTGSADCGDTSDQYKSSSESGHGTMHSSSARDNKSLASAYSSRFSALSHLDTSLDSDHSANYSLWEKTSERELTEQSTGKHPDYQVLPTTNKSCDTMTQMENENTIHEHNSCSESCSTTPPLPPLSPPPLSPNCTSQVSPKGKYKLSLSTSALNSHPHKASELEHNDSECSKQKMESAGSMSKNHSGRKNVSGKSTGQVPVSCRHWNGKGKSSRNSANTTHRTGFNCRKPRCAPFSKQAGLSLAIPSYADYADPDWTSTTTGLDGESIIDDLSSDVSMSTSTMDPLEISMIRKQLEGLENMYSEVLHLLGVKGNMNKTMTCSNSASDLRHSRHCRISGSMSSLNARSSNSRGNHSYIDKRGHLEKRRGKELSSASKRLQRLESHVVTLARSVAHLSSEMRTQHMLVQELEHMRRDVTWVHERLHLMQLAQGSSGTSGLMHGDKYHMPMHTDWASFRKEVNELLNPNRAKKLTKFFGDEPPLIRQFLKRLGYEKYASQFESEKIGVMELPYLTEERLQKIGLPMGPRMRIMQEARAFCQQNQYKVYIV